MGLGGVPKRTRIERVERRRLRQYRDDAEWAEENEYGRWDALQTLVERERARIPLRQASRTACKFHVLFGVW
tara:strand:- start:188 stop:403 length:216 start_codon:yes stop_codon:yes gene_type:complete